MKIWIHITMNSFLGPYRTSAPVMFIAFRLVWKNACKNLKENYNTDIVGSRIPIFPFKNKSLSKLA